ncbi:FkbM family methyltransferase [Massilia sp. erpn]|uniref:FkbM family methyltransferase n=1 Tax=Massilia sp. erpn TaxID=2738142 RepID=UPI002107E07A|nr:FkbM family methyltransferase [Massilia sp. erpn]UTY58021.1 FkbM family methyltransferase [Massilia sp. erpn]
MNFLSYAPNFEDVLLWRALRHVAAGFYIDVGAADPLHGSVTQAFYQRGWRGVNLEPVPALHARLSAARPADCNLAMGAAAEATAEALLYEVADSQLSGFQRAPAAAHSARGLDVTLRSVALTTLNAVWEQHVPGPVHFLNIAVNGDEQAVLAGLDLARRRPWIVLLGGAAEAADGADAALQAARYRLAYHDGQKRYYVAQEQAALAAALSLPPHGADAFTLYEGHPYAWPLDEWRGRTAAAEEAAQAANAWATAHESGLRERAAGAEGALARLQQEHSQLQQEQAQLRQRESATRSRAEHDLAQATRLQDELNGIYGSTAWRLAKPLRAAVRLAAWGRGRLRHLFWLLRHGLAVLRRRSRGAASGLLKALGRRVLHFVTARPALAFFLRRQLGRFPRLVTLLRALAMRSVSAPASAPAGQPAGDLAQLPPAARQVFHELQRALHDSRQP